LFAEHGYHDTSVGKIAERAGVSLGTFYQYFRDRADVVGALVVEGVTHMLQRTDAEWRAAEGRDGLYRVIENFVSAYTEAGNLALIWEEVCHVEPSLAELRRDLERMLTEQIERQLLQASQQGLTRRFTQREATLAARALTSMVDRFCYVTYAFDPPADGAPSPKEAARLLTDLWASAVELTEPFEMSAPEEQTRQPAQRTKE
jgi:AcrR family transcriptional regulator